MSKVYDPYPYQRVSSELIIDYKKSMLWLDPGAGKTSITLTAVNDLMYDFFYDFKTVVFAPPKVMTTWKEEQQKWAHLKDLKVVVIQGTPKKRRELLSEDANVYVFSDDNIPRNLEMMQECGFKFGMMVLDEASHYKSPSAQRYRVLKELDVPRLVGLTGTPAPNGLDDIYCPVYLADHGKALGKTRTAYLNTYFYEAIKNGHIVYKYGIKDGCAEKIYSRLEGVVIAPETSKYIKLPEKIESDRTVYMSKPQQSQYRELKKKYCTMDGAVTAGNAGVLANKLMQLSSGAIYTDEHEVVNFHDLKLDALEAVIEENNGKPVMVAYNYKHSHKKLCERLSGRFRVATYKDDTQKKQWNSGALDVLLVHPKSCSMGLNLQEGGSTLIWYDLTCSLEDYIQLNGRIYRQGQENTVQIIRLVTAGTFDERAIELIQGKDTTQSTLMDAVRQEMA